jgi:hypothetical protein
MPLWNTAATPMAFEASVAGYLGMLAVTMRRGPDAEKPLRGPLAAN